MKRLMVVGVLIAAGCSKPTPYQEAVKKFDDCMERNKAESVCSAEKKQMELRLMTIPLKWTNRMCPAESRAATMADSRALNLSSMNTGSTLAMDAMKVARAEQKQAADALEKCFQERATSLKVFSEGMSSQEREVAFDKYVRSGQAERDSGLAK